MDWAEDHSRPWDLGGFEQQDDFADHVIEGYGLPDMNGDGRRDHRDVQALAIQLLLDFFGDQDDSTTSTYITTSVRKNGDVNVVVEDLETGASAEAQFDKSDGEVDVFLFK